MLNPDTNSDSPSTRSKGVRPVSAKKLKNHNITIKGQIIDIKMIDFLKNSKKIKLFTKNKKLKVKIINLAS